ncbi:MAG: heavy metal translocating P-type ATPase [Thiothrix sp.]|uniref:heavy metal translocating P-type ATPase n=1 Tax=Thiothrix sp. TaxID=1032 RepID=UPI002633637E|nr:heavy metal translocating P-type ATPase [Thiothrix sp.]MDD5393011.1 heavy metal translocating P-type ATPase [Thiothrix sp.]
MSGASDCFHCGQPIPVGAHYPVAIDGVEREMCCTGCNAVAQAIVENNLTDYYRFRTEISSKPEDLVPEALRQLQVYDAPELQRSFVRATDGTGNIREASLILEGIVCAACVWLNENHVKQLAGILEFRINYSTHRATLKWDNSIIHLSDVLKAISEIGYHAHPFDPGRLESLQKKEKSVALRRIAVAGLGMMQVMMIAVAMYIGAVSDMDTGMRDFLRWISLIMTTPVVFYSSQVFFTSAWRDLRRRRFGMDVPVSLAIGIAFSASVWATVTGGGEVYFDSVSMFTFLLLSGRYLEMAARHKAGQVAEELVRLMPATATRVRDGEQEVIPVSQLEAGDHVLIRPGEVVPADGMVIDGASSTNESLLTGESLPCQKHVGDALVGGTVNIESPLTMRVEKVGDNTVLASIIRLLERAQSEKPELARMAEKVASRFVPIILVIAAGVFFWWYQHEPSQAFWIALSVLVVTCPCAFSLATPAALTAATGLLTSKGVLTTRGHALETLARINHIIFDKTGTLSHGQLEVVGFQVLGNATTSFCKHVAAGLETASEHPVAHAIIRLSDSPAVFTNLTSESGRGVKGIYQQKRYRIGTESFVRELTGVNLPETTRNTERSEIFLGSEDGWLALISLADRLREEAASVVQELRALGVDVTLLSGDAPTVVEGVAQQLGIPHAFGGQLPEGKLAYLKKLQEQGAVVAMVGDGVNDAPVLAGAQVSIAMGSGSQLAQASADMVLLSENLHQLPFAVQTSRRMQTIIKQNFAWTILYNLLAIPLAACGIISPWMAAIGMSASSLIVVLNALRLKN